MSAHGEWVLIRLGPDEVGDRSFLAEDRSSWVRPFADAWIASLEAVEEEIQKRITRDPFHDAEGNSFFPCPANQVLLRRGVDD